MVISHNMTALNARIQFNMTTGKMQKVSEKLSSGYKINRAADDAVEGYVRRFDGRRQPWRGEPVLRAEAYPLEADEDGSLLRRRGRSAHRTQYSAQVLKRGFDRS